MSRTHVWLVVALFITLAACAPAPTPFPTAVPTITLTPTLAPAPSPTPTVGAVPLRTGAEAAEEAQIRIVNAAPESGAVDVYLEQGLIAGRLGFGAYTNPVIVTTDTYYLQAVPVNALPDSQVLADTTLTVAADQSYIVVITGTAETLIISVYQENLTELPANSSRIAFLNAVPRGPNLTPQIDNQPFNDLLDFGQVSASYVVDTGPHQILFSAGEERLAELDTVLAAQQAYTALLIGQPGAEATRVLLLSSALVSPGQVRFIHAAPETGPLTVLLNGDVLAQDIAYRTASDWQGQKPKSYTLELWSGSDDNPTLVAQTRLTLASNQAVEAVLLEDRGRPTLRIYPHNLAPTPPRTARLVIVNAALFAPTVYAQTRAARLEELPQVPGGANSPVVEYTASTLELLWVSGQGDSTRVIEWAGEVTFDEGFAYTYVITGTDRDPFLLSTSVGVESAAGDTTRDTGDSSEPITEGQRLRVINAVADPLPLRVRLNKDLALSRLGHQTISAYYVVDESPHNLRVGPAGDPPNAPDYLIATLPAIEVDTSLLLYDRVESMSHSLVADTPVPDQPDTAVSRVFNAVTDEAALLIQYEPHTSPNETFETQQMRISAGEATDFMALAPGTYDIVASRTTDDQVIAIVPNLVLEAQTLHELILVPDPNAEGYAVFVERTSLASTLR